MCDFRFRTEEKYTTSLPTVTVSPDAVTRKQERELWHKLKGQSVHSKYEVKK